MNYQTISSPSGLPSLSARFGELLERDNMKIVARRVEAFERATRGGLPNRKIEAWKYTDLSLALHQAHRTATEPGRRELCQALASAKLCASVADVVIPIVNGYVDAQALSALQLPAGLEVVSLAKAMSQGHPLLADLGGLHSPGDHTIAALNTAFMTGGVLVRVSSGAKITVPLHLRFIHLTSDEPISNVARIVIAVENDAAVTFVETHERVGSGTYHCNTVTEIVAGDRTSASHVRLADGDGASLALSELSASIGTSAALTTVNVSVGGEITRHQVNVTFAGRNSEILVAGTALLSGRQQSDTSLVVDHAVAECQSREIFKTAVDDNARGTFQGKIVVRGDSQKTNGRMMSGALLLSDGATMNNKPELEIFADDVACAHGATCGKLDEELIFYIMSRGISRLLAESLVLQAFLADAIECIAHDGVRAQAADMVSAWLATRKPQLVAPLVHTSTRQA